MELWHKFPSSIVSSMTLLSSKWCSPAPRTVPISSSAILPSSSSVNPYDIDCCAIIVETWSGNSSSCSSTREGSETRFDWSTNSEFPISVLAEPPCTAISVATTEILAASVTAGTALGLEAGAWADVVPFWMMAPEVVQTKGLETIHDLIYHPAHVPTSWWDPPSWGSCRRRSHLRGEWRLPLICDLAKFLTRNFPKNWLLLAQNNYCGFGKSSFSSSLFPDNRNIAWWWISTSDFRGWKSCVIFTSQTRYYLTYTTLESWMQDILNK